MVNQLDYDGIDPLGLGLKWNEEVLKILAGVEGVEIDEDTKAEKKEMDWKAQDEFGIPLA